MQKLSRSKIYLASLAVFSAGFLMACGGGGTQALSAPIEEVTINTLAATVIKDSGNGIVLDAKLENGVITGHACLKTAEILNVSLVMDGQTMAASRTERVADAANPCFSNSAHSAFVLQVPPEQASVLAKKGGSISVFPDGQAYALTSSIPVHQSPSPRIAVSKSSESDFSGLYCLVDGAPELRASFTPVPLSAKLMGSDEKLAGCNQAGQFTFAAADVQEWRHGQGVISTDSVWAWSGKGMGASAPVQALPIKTAKLPKLMPVLLAAVNDVTAIDRPGVKFDWPMFQFEFIGYTARQRGVAQGELAGGLRARGMIVSARLDLLNSNKLLIDNAAQEFAQFKEGYLQGSGGVVPDLLYVADEPFWTGINEIKTPQQAALLLAAVKDAVKIHHDAFPGIKLVVAMQPGTQMRNDVRNEMREAVALFDMIAYDPYIIAANHPSTIYDMPIRQSMESGACPAEQFERMDLYLSRCALAEALKIKPSIKAIWVMQAFSYKDASNSENSVYISDALRNHWRTMSGLSYKTKANSAGIIPWGWYLGDEIVAREPYLFQGSGMNVRQLLEADLIELVGQPV